MAYLCVNHGNDGAMRCVCFVHVATFNIRADFLFSPWEVLLLRYRLHFALLNSPRMYDKVPIFSLYTLIHSFSQTSDPCRVS